MLISCCMQCIEFPEDWIKTKTSDSHRLQICFENLNCLARTAQAGILNRGSALGRACSMELQDQPGALFQGFKSYEL